MLACREPVRVFVSTGPDPNERNLPACPRPAVTTCTASGRTRGYLWGDVRDTLSFSNVSP